MTDFWDMMLCSFAEVDRRFRSAYWFNHQGGKYAPREISM
jgi:hypothetical protein